MHRRRRVIVVVILLALIGGYSFLWLRHANQTKAVFAEQIARANQSSAAQEGHFKLGYEALDISGYPFHVTLVLKNPGLSMDSALMPPAQPAATGENAAAPAASPVAWDYRWQQNGDVRISANYFTQRYTLSATGNGTIAGQVNGQAFDWKSATSPDSVCELKLSHGAGMSLLSQNLFSGFDDPEKIFEHLRKAGCEITNFEIADAQTGAMLQRADLARFHVTIEEKGKNDYAVGLDVKIQGWESSDAFLTAYNQIASSLPGQMRPAGILPIEAHANVGKGDMEWVVNYRGPTSMEGLEDFTMTLDVPTFYMRNNLIQYASPLSFHLAQQGGQINSSVKSAMAVEYGAHFNEALKGSVAMWVDATQNKQGPEFQQFLTSLPHPVSPEELKQYVLAVVPSYTHGKTSLTADVTQQGAATGGTLNVQNFDYQIGDLYGVHLAGSMAMPPKGEMTLTCRNCEHLLHDLFDYGASVQRLAALFEPSAMEMPLSDALQNALLQFLGGVAEKNPENTGWIYRLVADDQGQMTLNAHPLPEVMMLGMQTIAPYLPKEKAPEAPPQESKQKPAKETPKAAPKKAQ